LLLLVLRLLIASKEDSDVWSHNAWDHVEAPAERLAYVEEALQRQRDSPVPAQEHSRYNKQPARHWDAFYRNNATHFFKDRKWIQLEFPQIADALRPDAGPYTILEVGCGKLFFGADGQPFLHIS
jgi:tRNAThr (cytosine32-N3)-methyltransferase